MGADSVDTQPPAHNTPNPSSQPNDSTIFFSILIDHPSHIHGQPVATHVHCFRGYFWNGVSQSATTKHADKLIFDIEMPLSMRKPTFLEKRLWPYEHIQQYNNPSTIFLDFVYSTSSQIEYRFGSHFDLHKLINNGTLKIHGENNNHYTGNAAVKKANIPEKYEIIVMQKQKETHDLARTFTDIPYDMDIMDLLPNSIKVADWFHNFLDSFMHHPSPFQNLRTFLRTPLVSPLFTNLPPTWQTPGSPMPFLVPIYTFINAMILNRFVQNDIKYNFMKLKNIDTNRLLRVIRDTLMGFTMCKVEGKYYGDKLYGVSTDDQQFVNGFNDGDTFFNRDDCEGRLQQGVTILNAILSSLSYSNNEIFDHIRQENHPTLAQLSNGILMGAIKCLQTIAWLFQEGIVNFKMIVGEATFASYPRLPNQPPKYTGHSFGCLIFLPHMNTSANPLPWLSQMSRRKIMQGLFPPALQIVEATGWMDEYTKSDEKNATRSFARKMSNFVQHSSESPTMRSCTTIAQVDDLYCSIYMMGEHLIFGYDMVRQRWLYGASPSQILQKQALMFTPRELIKEIYDSVSSGIATNPIVMQANRNDIPLALLTPTKLQEMYSTCTAIDNAMVSIQPYIHPPPNDSNEQHKRLALWQPLEDTHVPRKYVHRLVAFAVKKNAPVPHFPAETDLHVHPFMYSKICMLKWPPTSS